MRPDIVGTCVSTSDCHSGGRWIVALSFLGLGLLVGWLHGYHLGRHEARCEGSPDNFPPGDHDVE
jgi:hypothetical protein